MTPFSWHSSMVVPWIISAFFQIKNGNDPPEWASEQRCPLGAHLKSSLQSLVVFQPQSLPLEPRCESIDFLSYLMVFGSSLGLAKKGCFLDRSPIWKQMHIWILLQSSTLWIVQICPPYPSKAKRRPVAEINDRKTWLFDPSRPKWHLLELLVFLAFAVSAAITVTVVSCPEAEKVWKPA